MSEIKHVIGKDGKNYYYKDGKRIKASDIEQLTKPKKRASSASPASKRRSASKSPSKKSASRKKRAASTSPKKSRKTSLKRSMSRKKRSASKSPTFKRRSASKSPSKKSRKVSPKRSSSKSPKRSASKSPSKKSRKVSPKRSASKSPSKKSRKVSPKRSTSKRRSASKSPKRSAPKRRSRKVAKTSPSSSPHSSPKKTVVGGKVDVFDFDTFKKEYNLFKKYFKGTELYIRTAVWIAYKYEWLKTEKERDILDKEAVKGKKEFLERTTDVFEFLEILERWYAHFNPEKNNEEELDEILSSYVTCEDVLFNKLYRKYVDKEWNVRTKLWFADCQRPTITQ
jgi:hypothetical protein